LMTFLAFSHPSIGHRNKVSGVREFVLRAATDKSPLCRCDCPLKQFSIFSISRHSYSSLLTSIFNPTVVLLVKVEQNGNSSAIDSLSSWPLQLPSIGQRILFRRSVTSTTSFNCTAFTPVSNYVSFLL